MGDYAALAEFHYLREKPATATRVLVMEHDEVDIAGRFAGRIAAGDKVTPRSARVVAVLVESLPALSCTARDQAVGERFCGWRDRKMAAKALNAEVRCISRVVVHPQWRGMGLAVKLVREALSTATTAITEALAAMGRVHPFFALAGMTAHVRHPLPRDQRLLDALRYAGIEPWELASETRMHRRLSQLPGAGAGAEMLREELARWAGRGMSEAERWQKAREKLLSEVVYYVKSAGA